MIKCNFSFVFKELRRWTTEGGWFSSHGLTPKGLEGRGLKFESCNGKRLENNFMLSAHAH